MTSEWAVCLFKRDRESMRGSQGPCTEGVGEYF
jgi:hypothetical protein